MVFTIHPRVFMTYVFMPLLLITSSILTIAMGGAIQDDFVGWFPSMSNGLERLVIPIVSVTILLCLFTSACLGLFYKKHSLRNYAIITGLQFFNVQLLLSVYEAAPVESPFKIALALGFIVSVLSSLGQMALWMYFTHQVKGKTRLPEYLLSFNNEEIKP